MDTEKETVVTDTADQAADQAAEQQAAAETAVEAQPAAEEKPAAQAGGQKGEAAAEAQAKQPAAEGKAEEKGTAQPDPAAKLADAELRAAAALAGIPAARIPYAVRMADAGRVRDAATAAAQIAAIVRDVPELKQQAQGTGSGGNFARKAVTDDDKARMDFAARL